MAGSLEMYKELLTPVKDPEKSFTINIAKLLAEYLSDVVEGRSPPNFNSAALILQGSSSIYGKKVEHIHSLASQLYDSLIKQSKNPEQQQQRKEAKEKEKKENKSNDPFLSTQIKPGKNLSCLKKRNSSKKETSKKTTKDIKGSIVPVQLLSADNEERGDVFYDTRGESIGNTGDYAVNRCKLFEDGWLLFSTVNPKLIPSPEFPPDYYNSLNITEHSPTPSTQSSGEENKTESNHCSENPINSSPDEGLGTDPTSSGATGGSASGSVRNSEENNSETPTPNAVDFSLVDEGIGITPTDDVEMCDSPESVGIENVPGDVNDKENPFFAPTPARQPSRDALKPCQLSKDMDPISLGLYNKELLVRKKIQKGNIRTLPKPLQKPPIIVPLCCISEFCARTFFCMDNKTLQTSLLHFDAIGSAQNSKFVKQMLERIHMLKTIKKKAIDPIEDEKEIDIEDIERHKDDDDDGDNHDDLYIPFDDADVQIDNNPKSLLREPPAPPPPPDLPEGACGENPIELPSPDISHIAYEKHVNYVKEIHQYVQNSDLTQRVHAWEESVKPFLEELEHRESFDINLYGSRILNSFEDNNRKQTKKFRQFCKNKQKWEVHRYFMALLPLANVGNVSIDSERKDDGSDEISVTLLSRKMHHKELEAFGHNDGSHS